MNINLYNSSSDNFKPQNNFYFSTCVGIGDMIHVKSWISQISTQVEKIFWAPNEAIINIYKKNDAIEYIDFSLNFMKLIAKETNLIIQRGDFAINHFWPLHEKFGIASKFMDLRNNLVNKEYGIKESKYIVIHTKVRGGDSIDFDSYEVLNKILPIIKTNYNGKIVIMGDQEIDPIYTPYVSNIRKILLDMIPKEKIIDLSRPSVGISIPNIRNIIEDCSIMTNAELNIILGISGSLALSASVGKTLCYYPKQAKEINIERILNSAFLNPNEIGFLHRSQNIEDAMNIISVKLLNKG